MWLCVQGISAARLLPQSNSRIEEGGTANEIAAVRPAGPAPMMMQSSIPL